MTPSQGWPSSVTASDLSASQVIESRREQMEKRLERLKAIKSGFQSWRERYASLCAYFQLSETRYRPSDEFFGFWDCFLSDLKKALMLYQQQCMVAARFTAIRGSLVRSASAGSSVSPIRRSSELPRQASVSPLPLRQGASLTPRATPRRSLTQMSMQYSPVPELPLIKIIGDPSNENPNQAQASVGHGQLFRLQSSPTLRVPSSSGPPFHQDGIDENQVIRMATRTEKDQDLTGEVRPSRLTESPD